MSIPQLLYNQQSNILKQNNEFLTNQQKVVKFYLRRIDKSTIIVRAHSRISGINLLQLASQRMNIQLPNLCLFVKGQKIQHNPKYFQIQYTINQLDIVHVHNLQNLTKKLINISLIPYQCGLTIQQIQISTQSDQIIKQVLQKYPWWNQQLVFLLSSRKLDINKTFKQQFVQDLSIIFITSFTFVQDNKQIKQDNQIIILPIQQQKKLTKNKSTQYQELKKIIQPIKSLRKSGTLNLQNNSQINLSFKKKQKPSIYKSMRIPQTKQVIWQSDSSGDLNHNLRKQIPIKKNKNNKSLKSQIKQILQQRTVEKLGKEQIIEDCMISSGGEQIEQNKIQFSSRERFQLQNQLHKLLFSDSLENKAQVTQLQPPQMYNDDFFEQSQLLEINSNGDQIDDDQINDEEDDQVSSDEFQIVQPVQNKSIRSSLDLRQSIGKSRGTYVAPIPNMMVPTRDFQNFDQEDEQFDFQN